MANDAPIMGARSGAPDFPANIHRRTLLAGIPMLAAACTAPAFAAPVIETGDPGFAAVVAKFLDLRHTYRTFCAGRYDPAEAAVKAETDAIPHYTTERTFGGIDGKTGRLTTAKAIDCRVARDCKPTGLRDLDDFEQCCSELCDALDEREARIAKIKARHDFDRLNEEADALLDAKCEAIFAIENYPVRTFPDLVRKIELMAEDDYAELRMEMLLADIRRITGRA